VVKKDLVVLFTLSVWASEAPADDVSLRFTNLVGGGVTNEIQASIERARAISWFGSNNALYQLQWSSDTDTWNNLGDLITGTSSSNTVVDMVGSPREFFRVLSIQ